MVKYSSLGGMAQLVEHSLHMRGVTGSSPVVSTIKTHAKGAYKTPSRVSFSMQNRGKLPFLWQFTLFVVSSRIAVGICSILALGNRNSLTIAQKGFLHDKERMISSDLINEKKQFKLHLSNRGVIMLLCEV